MSRSREKSASTMSSSAAKAATTARQISGSRIGRATNTRSGGHGRGLDKISNQAARGLFGQGESRRQGDPGLRPVGLKGGLQGLDPHQAASGTRANAVQAAERKGEILMRRASHSG